MATHELLASKETTFVGSIDRDNAAVLTIDSGDEVHASTWGIWDDKIKPGMSYEDILTIRAAYKMGAHTLTGPIHVKNARPGDVLRIDVLKLRVGKHGVNINMAYPGSRGLLAQQFQEGSVHHFTLDAEKNQTTFHDRITIPLRPFLGVMGVAPLNHGPHSSMMPGDFGGNIDCADLTEGTTLFLPVWVPGAMFYLGDAHAVQGHGEVNGTALETSMEEAQLRLTVVPGWHIKSPRAETLSHWITMDFGATLEDAAKRSLAAMVSWISELMSIPEEDSYRLCSLVADITVTQVVNGIQGVHVKFPKLTSE